MIETLQSRFLKMTLTFSSDDISPPDLCKRIDRVASDTAISARCWRAILPSRSGLRHDGSNGLWLADLRIRTGKRQVAAFFTNSGGLGALLAAWVLGLQKP